MPSSLRIFANPDYTRIWCFGLLTGTVRWLEFLAVGIYAFEITQSPQLVALLALLRMSPFVLLGFFIGALTDIVNRKRWLIALTVIVFLVSTATAVAAYQGLATFTVIAIATLVTGVYWVTDMPLRRRLLVDAVDNRILASASAFDNITNYVTRAVGPICGGIAYQWLGIAGIFTLSAILYAMCLLLALGIAQRQASSSKPGNKPAFAIGMLLPPISLLRDRSFVIVLGITIVYNVWCFPLVAMIPVMGERDLALSAAAIGVLTATEGLGGAIAAMIIGLMATNRSLFPLYFWGPFFYLILVAALALQLTVSTATLAFIVAGAAAACFSAAQFVLVYLIAPPEMRGRATGILSIFIGTSALGMYNAGYLFEQFSSQQALWIMAGQGLTVMTFLGIVLWFATDRSRV
ncbi:MAG: MFS transporter, partial [Pseudomonadota bacterium]